MKKNIPGKKKIWYRIAISLLLLGCLTTISTALLLKKGINLDAFSLGPVRLTNSSLVWQKKLSLHIDTVTVSKKKSDEGESSKYLENISRNFKISSFLSDFFSSVTIKEIRIGNLTGAINIKQAAEGEPCLFTLSSDDLTFRSNLSIDKETLVIDIIEAVSRPFNSQASGQVIVDIEKGQFTGTLTANPGGSLPITLSFKADTEQISFQGKEAGRIETITPLVDLFGLEENIQRWITKYLKGSRYHLDTFRGILPWSAPRTILDNLYAEVRIEDCEYTFAPGLEPIKTKNTNVIFSKNILTITPQNSTFYGQSGEASWLDINFNDPTNIILTAHIKTNARADKDILTLLDYYNIKIPFKQIAGKTKTDLNLTINLNNQQVGANGKFLIDEGVIEWDHKNYQVTDAEITLENSSIRIDHITVAFEQQFIAGITGTFNAGNGVGNLDISLQKFIVKTGDSILALNEAGPQPTIQYKIRPDGHLVDCSSSSWKLDGLILNIGPLSGPFSVGTLSGSFPPALLTLPIGISADVSGSFSIREKHADFLCNILHYKVKDLVLESPGLPVAVQYNQGLTMKTRKTSNWRLNKIPTTFYPAEARYNNNVLSVISSRLSYGNFFDSHVSGQYNSLRKQGTFLLSDLQIKDKNIGHLLESNSAIPIEISGEQDQFVIKVPDLDLSISSGKKSNWSATFNNLSTIHQRSALLQQYSVDAGNLTIASKDGKKPYNFSAHIVYRYPILVKDSKPVDQLNISGKITDQGVSATVNNELHIKFTDHLSVTSENLGYNIPAILKFFTEHPNLIPSGSKKRQKVTATFEALHSSLFFKPDIQALADRIHFEYDGDKSVIHLQHGQGSMVMEIEGDQFTLEGKEFNDEFMEALIQRANLNNGRMTMAAKGSFDQSSVLIRIDDTTLKSLRPLNNMLALLNTVPALITFSYPEYNTKGLPINSAVVGMVLNKGLATIKAFDVNSPVFTMSGTGWINIPQNLMDMDFNVITQARTNVKKIPLLGYIIAGKEKHPSITLKVLGNLQDPKVEKSKFREVAKMPFAVLYRTLALPYHMVEPMTDHDENEQDMKNTVNPGETAEKKPKS